MRAPCRFGRCVHLQKPVPTIKAASRDRRINEMRKGVMERTVHCDERE